MVKESQGKLPVGIIILISIVVPVLVAILFFIPSKLKIGDFVYMLPHFHAGVNSLTTLVLIAALFAIKKGNTHLHRGLMTSAICLGILFLLSYVIYHSSVDSVSYGDINGDGLVTEVEKEQASGRTIYLVILLTHIVFSMAALPLVLLAYFNALKGNYTRHKKLVRFAYPIWLYVSITGVIVYWMISPYYL